MWDSVHEDAFCAVKEALASPLVRSFIFQPGRRLPLETDASVKNSLGYVHGSSKLTTAGVFFNVEADFCRMPKLDTP